MTHPNPARAKHHQQIFFVGERRDFAFLSGKGVGYGVKETVMDLKELFDSIENHLKYWPDTAPGVLAHELGVNIKDIEQAIRETEGITFRQYCENKRLDYALGVIEKGMHMRKDGAAANQRIYPRSTVPGAVVRYVCGGGAIDKLDSSHPVPILDLSQGGAAFFANDPERPGAKISLLISLVQEGLDLQLKGKIVYTAAVGGVAGYRYRIGVCFNPFGTKKGCNPPDIEKALSQLEKRSRSAKGSGDKS
jgi:hypothetical protein